jgi:hypothetical protein
LVSTPEPIGTAFKDLCLDTSAVGTAAAFWSSALGLVVDDRGDNVLLGDGVAEHNVWINPVPEPKTAKNRVHLDVHTAAIADLEALGARVLQQQRRWTVMADPEGAEFCAFVRPPDQLPAYRLYELVVDAADPERIATWWADRFGVEAVTESGDDFWYLEQVPGMGWEMIFGRVPEPKTAKNRVHWDVWGTTEELLAAGATLQRRRDDEISWDVLADPEGNEFCVFTRD